MANERLWTRDFVLAFGLNLFISMSFYLLMTSMAGYAVTEFAARESVAGLASSAFVVGAVISRIFTGKYMDFVGRKRFMVISLVVFVIASLAYIPANSVWLLIGVRLVHGAAFGISSTTVAAAVQTLVPPERRAEGTGYFGTSSTLSTALGPFLAVTIADSVGFTSLFLVCAFFSVCGLVCVLLIHVPERTPTPSEVAQKWRLTPRSVIDFKALKIAMVMFLSGMSFSVVLSFIDGYAKAEGFAHASSAFFVVFALAMLVSRLFVGRLQDVYGDNVVMYPILFLFFAGLVMLAVAPTGWIVVAAAVPMGFGFGSLLPCSQAIAVQVTSRENMGLAVSTFFILLDAGTGIGPVVMGAMVPFIGMRGVYAVAAGLVVVSAVLYFFFHGRSRGGNRLRVV